MTTLNPQLNDSHRGFLAILPRLQLHAGIHFRHENAEKREDRVAEVVALAWKWYLRLVQQGKDPCQFPSALANFAARAVRCGRRVCGQAKAGDVMNPISQQRYGFLVERLPHSTATPHADLYGEVNGQRRHDEYEERLQDNTRTPPDEQAAFRIDFRAWLRTLTGRERRLIRAMMRNERTKDLSCQFELSPGRISQLRRQFHDDWKRFCPDDLNRDDHEGNAKPA